MASIMRLYNKNTKQWEPVVTIKGERGIPGETPVKGVDYWTEAEQNEIKVELEDYITAEVSEKVQINLGFAESKEEMTDENKLYVLKSDGHIYAYMLEDVPAFINLADPSAAGDYGWERDIWYTSGSGTTENPGAILTNNFCINKTNENKTVIIRVLGLDFYDEELGMARLCVFKADENNQNPEFYTSLALPTAVDDTEENTGNNYFRVVKKESGEWEIETKFFMTKYPYLRLNANVTGGENEVIITVDEEIKYNKEKNWVDTGYIFTPTNVEERLISIENRLAALEGGTA